MLVSDLAITTLGKIFSPHFTHQIPLVFDQYPPSAIFTSQTHVLQFPVYLSGFINQS